MRQSMPTCHTYAPAVRLPFACPLSDLGSGRDDTWDLIARSTCSIVIFVFIFGLKILSLTYIKSASYLIDLEFDLMH